LTAVAALACPAERRRQLLTAQCIQLLEISIFLTGKLLRLKTIFVRCVFSALVLVRPNGHLLSPELSSSFGGSGAGGGSSGSSSGAGAGGGGGVIRTGLYPRSTTTTSAALHYAHSTPRVNAGDLSQPSLQAGQKTRSETSLRKFLSPTPWDTGARAPTFTHGWARGAP